MATQIQIQANRRSAQLSTSSSRTEPRKAISRINALKTGIVARIEATSGEGPAQLVALAAMYHHEFQPIGVFGRVLVDILIKDNWFLRRYRLLADRASHSSGLAFEAKRGGFVDTVPSYFNHLAELERRRALRRRQQSDVDSSVTDSPETENPEIGFVPQTTPNPAGPASAVDQHAAQHASRHDPAAAPALTHSPQMPSPGFGFVPHTTQRPSAPSPSAPPLDALRFQ